MIDYIHEKCKVWGWQTRGMPRSFPAKSSITRWTEALSHEQFGMHRQRWAEIYTGDGLAVQRAILAQPRATLWHRALLTCHYVDERPVKAKLPDVCELLSTSWDTREYWQQLDRLHHWLDGRLPDEEVCAQKTA